MMLGLILNTITVIGLILGVAFGVILLVGVLIMRSAESHECDRDKSDSDSTSGV